MNVVVKHAQRCIEHIIDQCNDAQITFHSKSYVNPSITNEICTKSSGGSLLLLLLFLTLHRWCLIFNWTGDLSWIRLFSRAFVYPNGHVRVKRGFLELNDGPDTIVTSDLWKYFIDTSGALSLVYILLFNPVFQLPAFSAQSLVTSVLHRRARQHCSEARLVLRWILRKYS